MTKRRAVLLAATVGCLLFGAAPVAQAGSKPWIWSWDFTHWEHLDFVPYLENGTDPHNAQWERSPWKPRHWTQQRGGKDGRVIEALYRADILRDQYEDDGLPVLEVGPGFYKLGGEDKRRVTAMVDRAYGITTGRPYGLYMIYDWRTKKPVGSYTYYGLQTQ